jgi:dolichol-phosphate mannosyltransferase
MAKVHDAVVLLPTYNERSNIEQIVPTILAAADVDILILDDNSPDGTGALAQAIADSNPRVTVMHRPQKSGLGKAYLAGFQAALERGYDRILQMDADFSHPIGQLPTLLSLSKEYDLVLGSRWIPGGGTENWPLFRKILSKGGSFYARTLLNVPIRDLTGGFKCFQRHVLEALPLKEVESTGYSFQIEMTYRTLGHGFSVKETPIVFVEREEGVSKMSRKIVLEAILKVPALRLKLGF